MNVDTTAPYVSGPHLALLYIILYSCSDPGKIVRIQVSGKTIPILTLTGGEADYLFIQPSKAMVFQGSAGENKLGNIM